MKRMRSIALCLCLAALANAADEPAALAARGDFNGAAAGFRSEAEALETKGNRTAAAMAWRNAADCMKMTGDIHAAVLYLGKARGLMPADAPVAARVDLMAMAGSLAALGSEPWTAVPLLEEVVRLAAANGLAQIRADALNDLGIARGAMGDFRIALAEFADALSAAEACGEAGLAVRVRQNRIVAAFQWWQVASAAASREDELKSPEEKAFDAMSAAAGEAPVGARNDLTTASVALRASLDSAMTACANAKPSALSVGLEITAGMASHRAGWKRDGFSLLTDGLRHGRQTGDHLLEAEALLNLAAMYLDDRRAAESLRLVDYVRALRLPPDPVRESRVELLAAESRHALAPDAPETLAAILRAIAAVGPVRSDLARTQAITDLGRPFRERAGRPYLLLADVAMRLSETDPTRAVELAREASAGLKEFGTASGGNDPAQAGRILARNAIEAFKAWELQDYYRDDCVNQALAKRKSLDEQSDPTAAVLHILPFAGRCEILLGCGGGLRRAVSPTSGGEVLARARRLRARVQWNDGNYQFLDDAESLYDDLIRPVAGILKQAGVRHLVVVPDGALGTIPFGVLRDRRAGRFLLEDFSLSVAPGLAMVKTEKEEKAGGNRGVLLGGVTSGSPGFSPLPAARAELAELAAIYAPARPLLDGGFSKAALKDGLLAPDTRIVHFATHGEFSGRADQTYLLCADGRLTLSELESLLRPKQFRGGAVDLLCLSACKTAAGDDRAALGLAGAAVKSGARAVVATLWQVDDAAASEIMTTFHRLLRKHPSTGKAESLRSAQLECLRQGQPFTHPGLWAPFILVGDWH